MRNRRKGQHGQSLKENETRNESEYSANRMRHLVLEESIQVCTQHIGNSKHGRMTIDRSTYSRTIERYPAFSLTLKCLTPLFLTPVLLAPEAHRNDSCWPSLWVPLSPRSRAFDGENAALADRMGPIRKTAHGGMPYYRLARAFFAL